MTGAHMLEVVHGLVDNLKVVMDGGTPYISGYQATDETCPSRWQDINDWHTTSSRYVWPVRNAQSSQN